METIYLGVIASSAEDMHFVAGKTEQTRTNLLIDWINEQVEAGGIGHPEAYELPHSTTPEEVVVQCIEKWIGWAVTLEEVDVIT